MTFPERINPPTLYRDAPYDYATVSRERLVFTAGACPLDAAGEVVAPGDLETQARAALQNLAVVLTEAGSSLAEVLKTTVYVVANERSDLLRVWAIVEEHFGSARPPSTLLGVSLLGYRDQLVEIEAIALAGGPATGYGAETGPSTE